MTFQEYGDQKVIPMPKDQLKPSIWITDFSNNILDQTEEFKKISSKPFDKKAKKGTVSAEVSSTRTGLQSTAINSSDTGSGIFSVNNLHKNMGQIVEKWNLWAKLFQQPWIFLMRIKWIIQIVFGKLVKSSCNI